MQPSHIAIAVGTALLWGFGFVTSKYGADHMPPLFFLALRFALMTLMLIWFVRPPRGRWLAVSSFALTMGVGHFGLFSGLVFCPPGEWREVIAGLVISFSMWQRGGHGDAAGPGFVH